MEIGERNENIIVRLRLCILHIAFGCLQGVLQWQVVFIAVLSWVGWVHIDFLFCKKSPEDFFQG